ncbi:MAG: hypothetical protein ACREJC_05695 [Tepidisphaeraceae bacterium]
MITSDPTWLTRLSTSLRQDPRKTGTLTILSIALIVMLVRTFFAGAGTPQRSSAEVVGARPGAGALPARNGGVGVRTPAASDSLRQWLAEPVRPVSRNLFLVKAEYFPVDSSKSNVRNVESDFWSALGKSMSVQADQRDKRENLLTNFKAEAAKLRLESTIMGPKPKAMIDGKLVGEGGVVASFRVVKIEARRITVEREGIRLEIQMK